MVWSILRQSPRIYLEAPTDASNDQIISEQTAYGPSCEAPTYLDKNKGDIWQRFTSENERSSYVGCFVLEK